MVAEKKLTHTDSALIDVVELTRSLIQCESVTPIEGGALELLEGVLKSLGFECHRLGYSQEGHESVDNLFAILKHKDTSAPHLCFAGHTDVVPAGPLKGWKSPPFEAQLKEGVIIGRGAADMKGGIAAFVSALEKVACKGGFPCTISLLITGDEEGIAVNGTKKVLKWMKEQNYSPDFCLVGEPTSLKYLGDTIKIGRRGSLNTILRLRGKQGHVAYPQLSDNPIPKMLQVLEILHPGPLEAPCKVFEPSNLEITSIDVGNQTTNLIPHEISARFNIRFNKQHTCESLAKWIKDTATKISDNFEFDFEFSGNADLCENEKWTARLEQAITKVTNKPTNLSTIGATSDARFIKDLCPVVEFGLPNATMHQVNEQVTVEDLQKLEEIYFNFIQACR